VNAVRLSHVHSRLESILKEISHLRHEMAQIIGSDDALAHMLFMKQHNLYYIDLDEVTQPLTKFKESLEDWMDAKSNAVLWQSISGHFRTNHCNRDVDEHMSAWELLKPIAGNVPYNAVWGRCSAALEARGDVNAADVAEFASYSLQPVFSKIDLSRIDAAKYVEMFGLFSIKPDEWWLIKDQKIKDEHLREAVMVEFILAVLNAMGFDIQHIHSYV